MKIKEFLFEIDKKLPFNLALSFDNVGLILGNEEDTITGVYVSLDINNEVIDRAYKLGANTILTHHPIIFKEIKKIVNSKSDLVIKCLHRNINVICCHTNADAIIGGVNDQLIKILGFKYKNCEIMERNSVDNNVGIGRVLTLDTYIDFSQAIRIVKKAFTHIDKLKVINSKTNRIIKKICIINGSGNSMISSCFSKDIDLIITGDITYHTAFEAIHRDVCLIDLGHFDSENKPFLSLIKSLFDEFLSLNKVKVYFDEVLSDVFEYI